MADVQARIASLRNAISSISSTNVELLRRLSVERADFPKMRVHAQCDRACELCTKHYWTGGSDLQRCTECGVEHERREPICKHCEDGETPDWDFEAHPDLIAAKQLSDRRKEMLTAQLECAETELAYLTKTYPRLRQHAPFEPACEACRTNDPMACAECGIINGTSPCSHCAECRDE